MKLSEILRRIEGRYVEEGECWIWTGSTTMSSRPVVIVNKKQIGVRVLMAMAKGQHKPGDVHPSTCRNPLCVNPKHVDTKTKSEQMKIAGSLGGTDPKRLVTIQKISHPNKKLTDAQVMEMRMSTESNVKVARRFGVSTGLVCRVRQHKTRAHLNPFAGLL